MLHGNPSSSELWLFFEIYSGSIRSLGSVRAQVSRNLSKPFSPQFLASQNLGFHGMAPAIATMTGIRVTVVTWKPGIIRMWFSNFPLSRGHGTRFSAFPGIHRRQASQDSQNKHGELRCKCVAGRMESLKVCHNRGGSRFMSSKFC